jgi:CRP-like cAMP-binding protein/CheY-like chemotaxis protein
MRENTAEILELANFKVTVAPNGKEGSLMAKEIKPDLIICDIMMPVLDGYGVLHILSKDPSTASIPFIFLTAKAEKSDMRKGMELGADDYLTKPFDDTELLNAIEARLKKNENIKKEFSQSIEGLNEFFDQARGLKELENLSKDRPSQMFKKKQIIFSEGDLPHYLYFINSGKVKVFKTHDDGKEYVTDIFKDGDFFGISSLFKNSAYTDSAIVLENSEICKIPKEDFYTLLNKNRDVATQFIKILANHVEEKEKQLLSFAYDTVRKRAAEALVQLEKRYRKEGEADTKIKITREDLAGIAGTATETVIRCLSDFKSDNLIEVKGREIVIVDLEGLHNIQY